MKALDCNSTTIKSRHKIDCAHHHHRNSMSAIFHLLAWVVGIPVGLRSGCRLATTLVATINDIIFFLSFVSVVYFSHRRSAWIKKLICKSWRKAQKPKGWQLLQTTSAIVGPPSGHFGFCRLCSVAGSERLSPALLGWFYLQDFDKIREVF